MNIIEKDVLALGRYLALLQEKIKQGHVELSSIKTNVVVQQQLLNDTVARYQPLIDSLDKKINDKQEELSRITLDESNTQFRLDEMSLRYIDAVTAYDKYIGVKNESIQTLNVEIEYKKKEIENLNVSIVNQQKKINELTIRVDSLQSLVYELQALQVEVRDAEAELQAINQKKELSLSKISELDSYSIALSDKNKELANREKQISIMEDRLKPDYVEVFKKYHNL